MDRSDAELQQWAHEHLTYEAGMLLHAVGMAATGDLDGVDRNAYIESFAVHVRCLRDFLWRDDRPKPEDALARDFCAPNIWEIARGELPAVLREIEGDRNRIGREIVHLTYHRLDIDAEAKAWNMREILREILACLARFAHAADPRRLAGRTREALALMRMLVPKDGEERLRIGPNLPGWSGATGPINLADVRSGTTSFPGFSSKDIESDSSS